MSAATSNAEQLQPEAIEETLRGLWQDLAKQNTDVTQVRMLNLLSYFPQPPAKDVRQTINAVAVQHPGRAITLIADPKPPRVETTIACRTGGEKLRACGEQITLQGTVNGEPVHSLAIALLLGGLPITVWWHGAVEFDDHVFQQLATTADHVVLDSRTWDEPAAGIQALGQMLQADNHHTWVSDLRWVALTSWRRIIAHSFDVTTARQALADIGEITIEYGKDADAIVDAVYLAAWWLSRTGRVVARLERNTGEIVLRTRPAPGKQRRALRIALRAVTSDQPISRVELLGTGEHYARVTFEAVPEKRTVRTEIEINDRPSFGQIGALGAGDLTSLLNTELSSVTPDPTYEDALLLASDMLKRL